MKTSTQNFFVLLISLFFIDIDVKAQTNIFPSTGAAGIGTLTPNTSASLDINSTSKGILIPRMTQAQRNAIVSPATGLMIFQTNNTTGFYYYNGTAWIAISTKGVNTTLSNLKTPTAVNQSLLPGTTNSIDLGSSSMMWRNAYLSGDAVIHGITIGLGSGNLPYNLAVGYLALYNNTIGNSNTANGYRALYSNTAGSGNTANGETALNSNTTGTFNSAIGYETLYFNTVGSGNTANGYSALFSNTSGYSNVAIGAGALYANTVRPNLVAVGDSALLHNSTGFCNTAIGSKSLYSNTTGDNNTAVGFNALYSNNGYGNTANGSFALYSNTTGVYNTATGFSSLYYNTGYNNTANGYMALYSNTTGSFNTAYGETALFSNTTGSLNTANAETALYSNTTGPGNTAIGQAALYTNVTGSSNTGLGAYTDVSVTNLANATAIGYNAIVSASNKVRIGNSAITLVESNAGWWTLSDGRFKNNIKEDVKGLEFIKLLRPVTYKFDANKFDEFLMQNYPDSLKEKRFKQIDKTSAAKASAIKESGFIAQEVAEAVKKSGYDFNGVHAPENPTDNWSLSYEKLVVPLVKAVQELSKSNDDLILKMSQFENLKIENAEQGKKLNDLQKQIDELRAMMTTNHASAGGNLSTVNSQQSSSLSQNVPNPFNHTTTINYNLPQQYSSAKIIVIDELGKTIQNINLSGHGKGNVNFSSRLTAGASYQYSLYVDGKLIGTKQMIVTR